MSNLIDSNEHIPSRRSEIFFWIIAAAAMLLFPGRNALNVTEAAWAETMREMLIGKIWWGEPFNWQLTPAGPSPVCWVVLPLTKLFGIGEAALRLPNAAAALLMLFGTKALGKKLFNKTVSRLAGWMMLSSYGFLFWGRCAAPDMFCAACATLAVALFAQQEEESGFMFILVGLTEPVLMPFRALLQRSERMRSIPIDFSLTFAMITVILLQILLEVLV